jgi:hypothetical protein
MISEATDLLPRLDPVKVHHSVEALNGFTKESLDKWVAQHTVTQKIGSQTFNMLIAKGEDPSTVLFAGGEMGNGLDALSGIARVRTIQQAVCPDATIVYQPNSTLSQDNMNFSKDEQRQLREGNAEPLSQRILMTLQSLDTFETVLAYGPSQGGVASLSVAAHPDAPVMGVAVIETPNVVNRNVLQLARDYLGSGKALKETTAQNFEEDAPLRETLVSGLTTAAFIGYGRGLLKPDTTSLIGIMRRASAKQLMQTILDKGGSVVHAWASGDSVSPNGGNLAIDKALRDKLSYESYTVEGDHSSTNDYLLSAALVQRAYDLLRAGK